ncbi:Rrf2 family transcriptional regulator [Armatimonas sp.]|uniref:RrF2 family transcriptional regulator n=1 Tax=Armatimonas sp. TaxID=1872638 RepID=UPI00286B5BB2|nr:Rrf2 family transcriptional regulator [Armatimonas sp.]
MTFTTKEDYGLRAVLDLAAQGGTAPVQAREIAARQQIPEPFLEQLLASLRRAEVIRSIRGAGGGYVLADTPERVTVGAILRALSGPLVPHELISGTPEEPESLGAIPEVQVVRGVWHELRAALLSVVESVTVAELLERRATTREGFLAMHI